VRRWKWDVGRWEWDVGRWEDSTIDSGDCMAVFTRSCTAEYGLYCMYGYALAWIRLGVKSRLGGEALRDMQSINERDSMCGSRR
jgi:hypothetical protein